MAGSIAPAAGVYAHSSVDIDAASSDDESLRSRDKVTVLSLAVPYLQAHDRRQLAKTNRFVQRGVMDGAKLDNAVGFKTLVTQLLNLIPPNDIPTGKILHWYEAMTQISRAVNLGEIETLQAGLQRSIAQEITAPSLYHRIKNALFCFRGEPKHVDGGLGSSVQRDTLRLGGLLKKKGQLEQSEVNRATAHKIEKVSKGLTHLGQIDVAIDTANLSPTFSDRNKVLGAMMSSLTRRGNVDGAVEIADSLEEEALSSFALDYIVEISLKGDRLLQAVNVMNRLPDDEPRESNVKKCVASKVIFAMRHAPDRELARRLVELIEDDVIRQQAANVTNIDSTNCAERL